MKKLAQGSYKKLGCLGLGAVMRVAKSTCFVLVVWCFGSVNAFGHHSYSASFDSNSPKTIEGVVKEVWFKNPHIRYYVTVVDEDGTETVWDARGLSPVKLVRQGWTKRTIKVGDRITLHGHTGRKNKTIMSILEITLEDGTKLSSLSKNYDIPKE